MRKRLGFFVLNYLRFFAKLKIKRVKPLIVGVGGSSGKTSLANFIYLILGQRYKVKQSRGKNSETGIPLDILNLSAGDYSNLDWLKVLLKSPVKFLIGLDSYDVYIAEMGIDSPKEPKNMSYLLKIIRPEIAVLTNIAYEHSVYFDPLVLEEEDEQREERILKLTAEQELLLLTSVEDKGTVVLNIDDGYIKDAQQRIKAKKLTLSERDETADFFIEDVKNYVTEFVLVFKFEGEKYKIKIDNPLPKHFAYSFVSAIAVAKACGISVEESIGILENNFTLPPGRMSVFKGIKDTVVIDSSYNNATLTPILDLLNFVRQIGSQRRRIGIIGDMRELGTMSKPLHEEVARKMLQTLDVAILIGPLCQKYILPILKSNNFKVYSYLNFTSAKSTILDEVRPKDIVLVKGSQNTLFLERAVELLLENPKDKNKLCRRGEYWEKIREKSL